MKNYKSEVNFSTCMRKFCCVVQFLERKRKYLCEGGIPQEIVSFNDPISNKAGINSSQGTFSMLL